MSDITQFDAAVRNVLAATDRPITIGSALTLLSTLTPQNVVAANGSNSGDYTTTSTSPVAVDGTNLAPAVKVPVGTVAIALAFGTGKNSAGGDMNNYQFAAGTGGAVQITGTGTSPFACMSVFVGDGSTQTFTLNWDVSAGTGTTKNSGNIYPSIVVILLPVA